MLRSKLLQQAKISMRAAVTLGSEQSDKSLEEVQQRRGGDRQSSRMFTWAQISTSHVQGSQYANLLEKYLDSLLNSKNNMEKSTIFGLKRPGV